MPTIFKPRWPKGNHEGKILSQPKTACANNKGFGQPLPELFRTRVDFHCWVSAIWDLGFDHKIRTSNPNTQCMVWYTYLLTYIWSFFLRQMPVSIPHIECLGNVSNAASPCFSKLVDQSRLDHKVNQRLCTKYHVIQGCPTYVHLGLADYFVHKSHI